MKIAVFHGSPRTHGRAATECVGFAFGCDQPRKGNTYFAAKIFMDELSKCGQAEFTEFFLPQAMPEFCTGCQQCLGGPREKCPHARHVTPVLEAILAADALVFTTPHFSGGMSGSMKNLLDHLDFLTMNVAPRREIFGKKAFIITTGAGSAAAVRPIRGFLKNWGVNRVRSLGLRMFTNEWGGMPKAKQARFEKKLRVSARKFYSTHKKRPYISTIFMYYMFMFVIKKYIGNGNYPYEYWTENNFFKKRPF
ncbi:MAG: NAD(P)H-dependent oxidoreductase [Defluviitaleaceae bacterium]|nr:NAD(P)H-dependent oxidoreductase [Defluviitaleaceae bacterium]